MLHSLPLGVSLLLLPAVLAEGIYSKSSPVLQVSSSNYDTLIARSNHTSILEFYAPWCGHCKNLQPAYEKAAKSLTGLAKVAAVNCDDELNKPFCGSMGVQGFPTLKIVKPGKKPGKPIVEDYQGGRTAKDIVDAVVEKIPNHVKRLKDEDYEAWLSDGKGAKAILFSDKGTTSALLKAVAIDFLGAIGVAQIREKETEAVEAFNVEKFPTLVLMPGDGKDPITYNGKMKKDAIVAFLSQAATPNPDPAPKKAKSASSSKQDKSKASKASSSFAKASASQASSQAQTDAASQTLETLETENLPTESPDPQIVTDDSQKPIKLPDPAPPIPSLSDGLSLQQHCLNTKAGTCILLLLPQDSASPDSLQAISSLSEIQHKHASAKRNLFPFFQLPVTNSQAAALRTQLSLSSNIELIALNGKRAWYRHYTQPSFSQASVEDWIDAIRMGEGSKEKLPEELLLPADELPPMEAVKVDLGSDSRGFFETTDPEAMKEKLKSMRENLKAQMPEGVDFEFEEIDDEEYDRIMKQSGESAGKKEAEEREVEEKEKAEREAEEKERAEKEAEEREEEEQQRAHDRYMDEL